MVPQSSLPRFGPGASPLTEHDKGASGAQNGDQPECANQRSVSETDRAGIPKNSQVVADASLTGAAVKPRV